MATTTLPGFSFPLKGLEIVPATLLMSWVMMLAFTWLSGWGKTAHQWKLGSVSLPMPTKWTLLSGIGAGLILVTVPLSLTFKGVSIPFVQLLMRGDILIIAPVVDLLNRRKVGWYSWAALGLTAIGMFIAVEARGGIALPPLCWIVIGLYTIGYFTRLAVMTRIAKSGAEDEVRRYYVEEQIVATPVGLAILAILAIGGAQLGMPADVIKRGFVEVWTSSALVPLAIASSCLFAIAIVALTILLNRRENTYCVPLERSASILAGIIATYILSLFLGQKAPTAAELEGAGLLVLAIAVLTLGPRFGAKSVKEAS